MSENVKIVLAMKSYPHKIIRGSLIALSESNMKITFDKEYKPTFVKYFSKPVSLRIDDEGKLKTFGDGYIIGISESKKDGILTIDVLVEKHSILNSELHDKYKRSVK